MTTPAVDFTAQHSQQLSAEASFPVATVPPLESFVYSPTKYQSTTYPTSPAIGTLPSYSTASTEMTTPAVDLIAKNTGSDIISEAFPVQAVTEPSVSDLNSGFTPAEVKTSPADFTTNEDSPTTTAVGFLVEKETNLQTSDLTSTRSNSATNKFIVELLKKSNTKPQASYNEYHLELLEDYKGSDLYTTDRGFKTIHYALDKFFGLTAKKQVTKQLGSEEVDLLYHIQNPTINSIIKITTHNGLYSQGFENITSYDQVSHENIKTKNGYILYPENVMSFNYQDENTDAIEYQWVAPDFSGETLNDLYIDSLFSNVKDTHMLNVALSKYGEISALMHFDPLSEETIDQQLTNPAKIHMGDRDLHSQIYLKDSGAMYFLQSPNYATTTVEQSVSANVYSTVKILVDAYSKLREKGACANRYECLEDPFQRFLSGYIFSLPNHSKELIERVLRKALDDALDATSEY